MQKYVVLNADNTVAYTFPEVDPARPTITVDKLYSADFLQSCLVVDESVVVNTRDVYDPEKKTFSPPPIPDPVPPVIPEPTTDTPSLSDRLDAIEQTMLTMMLNT